MSNFESRFHSEMFKSIFFLLELKVLPPMLFMLLMFITQFPVTGYLIFLCVQILVVYMSYKISQKDTKDFLLEIELIDGKFSMVYLKNGVLTKLQLPKNEMVIKVPDSFSSIAYSLYAMEIFKGKKLVLLQFYYYGWELDECLKIKELFDSNTNFKITHPTFYLYSNGSNLEK